jgi:2-(1,2-epoxy-1,2-dihydrophenyl)acetyl-CoA isomerase
MYSSLSVERNEQIAHIRFNRPEAYNALNEVFANELLDACRALALDQELRVVILSGNGKAFMAGGDLPSLRADPLRAVEALIPPLHAAIRLLSALQAPVIASVHGAVAGAGLSLALAADLVIAAENTRFSFAYTDIGTSCDGGMSWSLPRLVGLRKALEIALLGQTFDAQEALAMGLLNTVVEAGRLPAETQAMALQLASRELPALGHLKRLLRQSFDKTLSQQLDEEYQAFRACAERPEFVAAIDAFYARRQR